MILVQPQPDKVVEQAVEGFHAAAEFEDLVAQTIHRKVAHCVVSGSIIQRMGVPRLITILAAFSTAAIVRSNGVEQPC